MGIRLLRTIAVAASITFSAAGELKIRPVPVIDQHGRRAAFGDGGPGLTAEGHYFADESNITEVIQSGGRVVSRLPDNQYIVAARAGTPGTMAIDPASKISAEVRNRRFFLVEFFPDIEPGIAESMVSSAGFMIHHRPDLPGVQLLIEGSALDLQIVAENDSVAYIFPAARKLVRGESVYACLNGATGTAGAGQYIGTYGDGWDGLGRGSAALTYSYQRLTDKLPADLAKAVISRALEEWSKYARVSFSYTDQVTARRNLNFLFASGSHGDDFAFDGPGRVLAHTFFPYLPNPEPIAGDLHVDADESWQVGVDIDLFSVVLHELGHALGLGHADSPSAVMYPYYRRVTGLAIADIAAIQTLYAPGTGSPTAAAPLVITAPGASNTAAAATDLSGTTTGGTGEVRVTWSSDRGASGTAEGSRAWIARAVPLEVGVNSIRFTATDVVGSQTSAVVLVTRSVQAVPDIRITSVSGTGLIRTVSGTAAHGSGIRQVRWTSSAGTSGIAQGTITWSAPVAVREGQNTIRFTATAKDGSEAAADVQLNVTPSRDITAPALTITAPGGTSSSTSQTSIRISGSASDNVGVSEVRWSTNTGFSGIASGTTAWTTDAIPVYRGYNVITIRAFDAAGNMGWRSVGVTKN